MKIKEKVKKAWEWTKRLYLAAFLATSIHVVYDSFKNNLPRIERGELSQQLDIHRYKVNINGKEKLLTLVGETHQYNKIEQGIAKRLIDEHEQFACETGEGLDISLGNQLYMIALAFPSIPYYLFNGLGSGRWYDGIKGMVERRGHQVYALEKDPFCFLSLDEKIMMLGESIKSIFIAPLAYYKGKKDASFDASEFANFRYKESLGNKRDVVMAKGIANLLKRDGVDNLLANFGVAHLEGITQNLSQHVQLESIDSSK